MSAYDPNKTYRLKNGGEVLSLHQGEGSRSVHGVIKLESGSLRCCVWHAGHLHPIALVNAMDDPEFWMNLKLIEVKPRIKRTVWLNVWPDSVEACKSKETADRISFGSVSKRLACVMVEIDCEEGEGL